MLLTALLLLFAQPPASNAQNVEPFKFFRDYVGLQEDQIAAIRNGKAVAKIVESSTPDTSARGRAVLDPARTCLSRVVACRATVEWCCPRADERGHLGCVEAYAAYTVVVYEDL